jgi:hypothetical protein
MPEAGRTPAPIPWPMRWHALYAATIQLLTGRHAYIATGCLHGSCTACRSTTRVDGSGPKIPRTCKWCPAPCRCPHCRRPVEGNSHA